ncbi:hypothetical protein [Planococcus plakortidis]|uniref:hypothetical protein n=1 Tax=Planococcus plakortidis TaxID=1038856 RepID=UPI00385F6DBD
MKKITAKDIERINELLNKVLNTTQSLDEAELAELQAYLEILAKIQEDSEEEFSEKTDSVILKKTIELVLKKDLEVKFNSLPYAKHLRMMKAQLDELEQSPVIKKAQKQAEDKEFESFYADYTKKHGTDL